MKTRPLALLLAGFAAASACGKRGDPLPPQRIVPQPVSELRLLQRGDELILSFVAPRAATDGSRLPVLDVEIQRATGEGDFEALAQKESLKAAPGEALFRSGPLPAPGTVVRAAARALAKGRASPRSGIASLRVLVPPPVPGSLRAAPAPLGVAIEWTYPVDPASIPPPAPEPSPSPSARPGAPTGSPSPSGSPAPVATAAAEQATATVPAGAPPPALSPPPAPPAPASPAAASPAAASPAVPAATTVTAPAPSPVPAASVGGAASAPAASPTPTPAPGASPSPRPTPPPPPPPGFLVYRRAKLGSYGAALAPKPTLLMAYLDEGVTPGEEWCYVVRFALRTDPLAESASSPEACVEVRDVASPAAPLGLALLSRPEGVEISWSASPEADLAAYRVYRAEGPDAPPVRLAEVPAGQTEHVDETAVAGTLYVYSLGAVDTAGNESPRSASAQIRR